ncbi:XRE family transcriptional regulator [Kitasatospora purpeofusca]|uniref:XRE family transcriptional regulator n=1 Tax=Kitasatospora purpeofusca TaxID=67352 RepID=UPI0035D6294D
MIVRVDRWTGLEARALQETLRMSDREFAERLGIARNTVASWRTRGVEVVCTDRMAQVLDSATVTLLTPQSRTAFHARLEELAKSGPDGAPAKRAPTDPTLDVVSHQFIPVQLGAAANLLFELGADHPSGPAGLDQRVLEAHHGTGIGHLHVYRFGIGVMHVRNPLLLDSVTELALWRYRSYPMSTAWTQQAVSGLVAKHSARVEIEEPEYVLSAYEIRKHPWNEHEVDTGLHLVATPSVLVDRSDPETVVPLGVESERFAQRWTDLEAIPFAGGVSRGVASWSGVAYCSQLGERALPFESVVALELNLQALWALSSHLFQTVEAGKDLRMPSEFGWRWLRGVHSRLTSARTTETAQHRAMRAAVVCTSELPSRLEKAWAALKEDAE